MSLSSKFWSAASLLSIFTCRYWTPRLMCKTFALNSVIWFVSPSLIAYHQQFEFRHRWLNKRLRLTFSRIAIVYESLDNFCSSFPEVRDICTKNDFLPSFKILVCFVIFKLNYRKLSIILSTRNTLQNHSIVNKLCPSQC